MQALIAAARRSTWGKKVMYVTMLHSEQTHALRQHLPMLNTRDHADDYDDAGVEQRTIKTAPTPTTTCLCVDEPLAGVDDNGAQPVPPCAPTQPARHNERTSIVSRMADVLASAARKPLGRWQASKPRALTAAP